MFTERLNILMYSIGAKGAQVAECADFDRTNISRLRSGKRTPPPSSRTIQRLIQGLYIFCENNGSLDNLCSLVGTETGVSRETICSAISRWLYEGEEISQLKSMPATAAGGQTPRKNSIRTIYRNSLLSFGERLDAVMEIDELSNVRLSQLINVDASLISRYRSGVRIPQSNSDMAWRLSRSLLSRAEKIDKTEELSRLIGSEGSDLNEESLHTWLCDFENAEDRNASAAEQLLEAFDSFSAETGIHIPGVEEVAPSEILEDKTGSYSGYTGLQHAVIRFLGNALKLHAKEIFIYSDQNLDWLPQESPFWTSWASLLNECVKNGITIHIIHHVERNLQEFNDSLMFWLPLYMSGMIDACYCTKPGGDRFSHTMFLCPDHFCIEAFHVIGCEENGTYHFNTSQADLLRSRSFFEKLREYCRPLIKIKDPRSHVDVSSGFSMVLNTLVIATMPEKLVRAFGSSELEEEWKIRRAVMENTLSQDYIYEYAPLVNDEALFKGEVHVEKLPFTENLRYTPELYAMHISNILDLLEKHPNYRYYALPETPFHNLKLLISNDLVRVTRAKQPYLSFIFTHPSVLNAFDSYIKRLKRQVKTDRAELIHLLKSRYL